MTSDPDSYDEVYAYTMTHGSPSFILQHVVDAYAAQTATSDTKPIKLVFALVGLYLHVEHQYTGRAVQRVHMALGRQKGEWPSISLPQDRGDIRAADVARAAAGPPRDAAIDAWCRAVWTAFSGSRAAVVAWLHARHAPAGTKP